MSDRPSSQRKGSKQDDYKNYPPPSRDMMNAAATTSTPYPSSQPPAFYPGAIRPQQPQQHDSRMNYERPSLSSHSRRSYEEKRSYEESGRSVGPSSSSSSTTKPEYHHPHAEQSRMSSAPFTSVGMPATPDVHRGSSSSRKVETNRWEPQRGGSPPRRTDYQKTSPPTPTAASTVNVAMPHRRGSRGDTSLPASYVVGSDRGRGTSASMSTTPGYGLISISTTNSTANPAEPSSTTGSVYVDQNTASSSRQVDAEKTSKPSLEGFSRSRNGWKYRLIVVQHPTRARMCGFGDKDRRPLSPTLIVKLIITDEETGKEVSPWKVNTSLFFLASDLCHPDDLMLSPRNVLVHQHAASIPTAMLQHQSNSQDYHSPQQPHTSNYPTHPINPALASPSNVALPHLGGLYLGDRSRNAEGTTSFHAQQSGKSTTPPTMQSSSSSSALTTVTTEHYTRNLVGAAVTSANVLKDEQDNYSIFFVLQDLSVRTEGVYRIRLMFTDLAQQDGQTNEGVSDALAEAYTEPFSVYSPRRFPGMLEPTDLSKKLASQGIKIAVRSDKKKRRRDSGPGQGPSGEIDELEDDED